MRFEDFFHNAENGTQIFYAWQFMPLKKFLDPTFVENGIFMSVVVFFFSHFAPVEITVFEKNLLHIIEDIDFMSSNSK